MRPASKSGWWRRAGSSRATCALSTSASATGWGRWQCWRPWGSPARWRCNAGNRGACREIADCGFRIADLQWEVVRDGADPDNPQSAIRNPQLGGVVTRVGVDVGGTFTDLVARGDVLGVAERMGPTGVLEPLADAEVERVVAEVQALAPESVAVAFLFAFRHPEHERRIAAALRGALAGVPIAASHEVLPVFREFERVSSTTVEAYLRPKVT